MVGGRASRLGAWLGACFLPSSPVFTPSHRTTSSFAWPLPSFSPASLAFPHLHSFLLPFSRLPPHILVLHPKLSLESTGTFAGP